MGSRFSGRVSVGVQGILDDIAKAAGFRGRKRRYIRGRKAVEKVYT